jgi:RimJ/RimL family protein N-acetyltransferase
VRDDEQQRVPDEAELGYRLLRRYWRRGLAGEGARELLRYGFTDLGLTRVIARTMAVNAGSRATMTSVGMVHVRDFPVDFDEPVPGAEHGEVEYAITREQWLRRQRP